MAIAYATIALCVLAGIGASFILCCFVMCCMIVMWRMVGYKNQHSLPTHVYDSSSSHHDSGGSSIQKEMRELRALLDLSSRHNSAGNVATSRGFVT